MYVSLVWLYVLRLLSFSSSRVLIENVHLEILILSDSETVLISPLTWHLFARIIFFLCYPNIISDVSRRGSMVVDVDFS